MTTVIIANFSGMQPIVDASLLPDSNAQYSENTWLYRGLIRGFRHETLVYTNIYPDTQQVYRIPTNDDNPPDFIDDSLWLEYPDPFMATVRNPTINDQYNRYFFFPSDQYNSAGVNPNWPAGLAGTVLPQYNTLDGIQNGSPAYTLGIPIPTTAPVVTSATTGVTTTATAATASGSPILHVASTTNVLKGMFINDTTVTTTTGTTSAATAVNNAILTLTSVSGILVGMKVADVTVPSAILSGTTVASVNTGALTVTLSTVVLSPGVGSGDSITFVNSNQITTDTAVQSVDSGTQVTMNVNAAYAGVLIGDTIVFSTPAPETRAYVYTYVSNYSEEGPPSPATIQTGDPSGTWSIVVFYPTATEAANRNLTAIRIYRTVTDSAGNASYYQVAQIPIGVIENAAFAVPTGNVLSFVSTTGIHPGVGLVVYDNTTAGVIPPSTGVSAVTSTTVTLSNSVIGGGVAVGDQIQFFQPGGNFTYTDSALPTSITSNQQLQTLDFTAPPADLQGVVMMANGIAAGWSNEREVWFSAPYQLWAWPATYALSVDYPIVGMVASGSSLMVMTEGPPFIITGVTPGTMTVAKLAVNEPCIGRGSIASSQEGAYYASPNGVVILTPSSASLLTQDIYEKEFHFKLQPWHWMAGRYGNSYVIFVRGTGLPNIDPDGDTINGLVLDQQDANVPFSFINFNVGIQNLYQDELSGQLFIVTPAAVFQWNPPVGNPGTTTLRSWEWRSKMFRFTMPQQFKAFLIYFDIPAEVTVVPGVRDITGAPYNQAKQYMIAQVYADGQLLTQREIQKSGEVLLINNGSKWTYWEVRMQGQVQVRMFKMASSVKELKSA